MGTATLPDRANSTTINQDWFNEMLAALALDLPPRNAGAVATDEAGSLGTAALEWRQLFVETGDFKSGDIKLHHSMNGLNTPGAGWMLCDGRQVTQAAYDTEHGAGKWASEVGSSQFQDLYLPNFTNRLPVGADTTTQTGAGAITPVGNANHVINISHLHQWYDAVGNAAANDNSFLNYSPSAIGGWDTATDSTNALLMFTDYRAGGVGWTQALATDSYTNAGGSTSLNIQPESIEFQFYMRVI